MKIIDPSLLRELKTLRAYELAKDKMATPSENYLSGEQSIDDKIIEPSRFRELKTLRAYELAKDKMATSPDSPKELYEE